MLLRDLLQACNDLAAINPANLDCDITACVFIASENTFADGTIHDAFTDDENGNLQIGINIA